MWMRHVCRSFPSCGVMQAFDTIEVNDRLAEIKV
jgi:hypothetical protein